MTDGGKAAPTQTIEQRRETLADGASSLLLRTNGPGRVAKVTDPGGGTQTVYQGLNKSHRYEIWFIPAQGGTTTRP